MAKPKPAPVTRMAIDQIRNGKEAVVFVDARSATALHRNPQQVPGAIHLPLKKLDANLQRLSHNRTIVTYCT